MEVDASIQTFDSEMPVPSSTRRSTTVKKWVVTDLQQILTPSFITVDIFALVIPYFLLIFFFLHKNDDFLGHQIDTMMFFMTIILYKRNGLS